MASKCIVIVREVYDTRDLTGQVLNEDGQVQKEALAGRFEPEDLNALEMALRVKDDQGGTVTAITVGKPRAVDVLRECLYRGTDEVICIDADPATLDTQAKAALIARTVEQQGAYDLLLVGVTVSEGENSMIGAHVAALLGIEQISYIDAIDSLADGKVVGKRAIEMGYEYVEAPCPALLSVGVALVEDDPRTPRSAKAMLKLKAKKAEIPVIAPADIGLPAPAEAVLTAVEGFEAVPERVIESTEVDAESEEALKAMLHDVLKGE